MFSKEIDCGSYAMIAKYKNLFFKIPIIRCRIECKADYIIQKFALFFNGLTILKIKKPLEYLPSVLLQTTLQNHKKSLNISSCGLSIAKALNEDEKIEEKIKALSYELDEQSTATLYRMIARLKCWYGGGGFYEPII